MKTENSIALSLTETESKDLLFLLNYSDNECYENIKINLHNALKKIQVKNLKNGDFISWKTDTRLMSANANESFGIGIFKEYDVENEEIVFHVNLILDKNLVIDDSCLNLTRVNFELSKDSDKDILLKRLDEKDYFWNSRTKKLEMFCEVRVISTLRISGQTKEDIGNKAYRINILDEQGKDVLKNITRVTLINI